VVQPKTKIVNLGLKGSKSVTSIKGNAGLIKQIRTYLLLFSKSV
jgi:hypothetical protein